jgi:dihydrofolate reductase
MDMLTLIAAFDHNRAIGVGGRLPWHLPDDLKRFKALTLGKTVLMGRKTAESLGRALPGRRNLVLTHRGVAPFAGMEAVASLPDAIASADELVVIGGGELYAQTLGAAARLLLTEVETEIAGADAWFPPFERRDWREISREHHGADARHLYAFDFVELVRAA